MQGRQKILVCFSLSHRLFGYISFKWLAPKKAVRINTDAAAAFISIGLNALPHLISLFLCPILALNMQVVCITGCFFPAVVLQYSILFCSYIYINNLMHSAGCSCTPESFHHFFSLPLLQLSVSRCDSQCCSFNTHSHSRVFSTWAFYSEQQSAFSSFHLLMFILL